MRYTPSNAAFDALGLRQRIEDSNCIPIWPRNVNINTKFIHTFVGSEWGTWICQWLWTLGFLIRGIIVDNDATIEEDFEWFFSHEFEEHVSIILFSDWPILILTYFYRIFTAKKWNFTTKSDLFRKKTIPSTEWRVGMAVGIFRWYIYVKNRVKYVPAGDLYGTHPG